MKTEFIAHRINTLESLSNLPADVGVELDLRDFGNRLILQHDPFMDGEDFENFLTAYQRKGTLILNIKSERIEWRVLELIEKYKVENYFFLDSSFPMIIAMVRKSIRQIAIRFSEFEPIESCLALKHKIDWVWVDCFNQLPINLGNFKILKEAGFKLCLVSPELQGRAEEIKVYRQFLENEGIVFDAICTKFNNFSMWKS